MFQFKKKMNFSPSDFNLFLIEIKKKLNFEIFFLLLPLNSFIQYKKFL